MKSQPIGTSSLTATRLAYGCMRVTAFTPRDKFTPEHEAAGRRAILAAYEAGYTHFDHADIYGNGLCEEVFGRVLREVSGMRERIVIGSKCGIRWQGDPTPSAPHRYDFSREHINWSCDQSLKRLGIEQLDLYMLHRPDFLADPEEIAAAFTQLKAQGKVREFGVSNFRPSLLAALQHACPMPLVCNQVEIHLGRLDCFEDGTLDQCLQNRVTPVSWSPLAGGMFGDGGWPDDAHPRAHTLRELIGTLDHFARQYGVSRTVVTLAWLLKHPAGIVPIVGTANPDRIRDAVRADSLEMSREDWYTILRAARGAGLP